MDTDARRSNDHAVRLRTLAFAFRWFRFFSSPCPSAFDPHDVGSVPGAQDVREGRVSAVSLRDRPFCILLFAAVLILPACKKNITSTSDYREQGADIRLRDFDRKSYTIDGKEEWDLAAQEAYVYRTEDKESRIIVYGVDFQQYENGKKTGRIKAERGDIDYKKKLLNLSGKVTFVDPTRSVSSEHLTYAMEDKILESKDSVLLVEGTTTTHCRRGITVNRETNVQVCRAPAVLRITREGDQKGFEDL